MHFPFYAVVVSDPDTTSSIFGGPVENEFVYSDPGVDPFQCQTLEAAQAFVEVLRDRLLVEYPSVVFTVVRVEGV